jgi:hypothetical protein
MPATLVEIQAQRCIGCGAISSPQPCTCDGPEHRLDLVAADEHAAAVAAVEALSDWVEEQQALLTTPLRRATWDLLRARARVALHALPPAAVAGEEITTWACDSCGYLEAPQPCIGVCVRPTVSFVPATAHHEVLARARELEAMRDRLAVPLRQLAWTTPRDWDATASAIEQVIEAALT